jgi:CheY-like chemotaxis protein
MKKFQIATVDDEPEILEILNDIIQESFDCEIESFSDPIIALDRFQEKKFDAISIDHRMPVLKGMDIVKLLRSSEGPNSKTRILLVTANIEEAECSYPALLDEVIFIEKPIKQPRFLRWMDFILNQKIEKK